MNTTNHTLSSVLSKFQKLLEDDGLNSKQASFVIGQIFAEATKEITNNASSSNEPDKPTVQFINQKTNNNPTDNAETVQQICQYIEKKMEEYSQI